MAGGALQAATGFGFSLVASPLLVAAYGSGEGIATLTVLSVAVNVATLATERRRPVPDVPLAAKLVAFYVPGAALGAVLLRLAGQDLLDVLVAVAVLAAIAVRGLPERLEPGISAPVAGVLGGVFGISSGVSGPPLVLHLLHVGTPLERTRDTLAVIFLATALVSLVVLPLAGVFALPGLLGLLLAAVLVGHVAGRGLFARMGPAAYERVVLATMGASALALVVLLLT